MSKADDKVKEMLHKLDLIPYVHGPKNVILVTTDDIVEIMHELIPYTMHKLDEVQV